MPRFGGQSLVTRLCRALVHVPGEEFTSQAWREYGYDQPLPDQAALRRQHADLVGLLVGAAVEIELLEQASGIQSAATCDPALVTDAGAVILQSGKPQRRAEMWPMARRLVELGVPIIGWLRDGEYADGGDLLWLDASTLVIGLSYRTNKAGACALARILDGVVPDVRMVELPHWNGPGDVLHLMSAVSLAADDVAVVYPKPLPISMMRWLAERGFRLVEVPDEEFATLGTNVLALGDSKAIMCAGNPRTRDALAACGLEVLEFDGSALCLPRGAGPTCHVQVIRRE